MALWITDPEPVLRPERRAHSGVGPGGCGSCLGAGNATESGAQAASAAPPSASGGLMPHAVFVKVKIAPGRGEEATKSLREDRIPMVKQAPGFLRGTWFGDDHNGHGLVLFETEEQARQAASMVSASPDDPVQIESASVYQVHAEA
ncbi:MAG: hypothetical protein NVSMB55_03920 [Mycobacteriales bacterium]